MLANTLKCPQACNHAYNFVYPHAGISYTISHTFSHVLTHASRIQIHMSSCMQSCMPHSVHLDVNVDVADKLEGCEERHGAKHEKENIAGEKCVAKELDGLKDAGHIGSLEVIKEGIEENKQSSRPSAKY